jgi:molybdate transport system substrate-binding protein
MQANSKQFSLLSTAMRPLLLLYATALVACAPSAEPLALTIAVATDLAPWANQHEAQLSAALGGPVTVVAGPSGQLATQLLAGAPFDLLLSADSATLDRLLPTDRCDNGSRRPFATGHLALAVAPHLTLPATVATLASDAVTTIAIANPEHAPYGRLARAYLGSLPEAPRLLPKLVFAASAADAAAWVEQGAADAAVTAWSLLRTQPEARRRQLTGAATALPATGIVCGPAASAIAPRWQALTAAPWFSQSLTDAGFGPPP